MKVLNIVAVFLFLSSCAAWRVGETEEINDFKDIKHKSEKIKIGIVFKEYKTYFNEEEKNNQGSLAKQQEFIELTQKTYKKSGLFQIQKRDKKDNEFIVEISLIHKATSNTNTVIFTWATLFLYPSKSLDEYILKTTIKDNKGNIVFESTKKDSIIMYQQFFMLFAMPFISPYKVEKGLLEQLNRSTIVDVYSDPSIMTSI